MARLLSKMFSFQGRDTRADFLSYMGLSIAFLMAGVFAVFSFADTSTPGSPEDDAPLGVVPVVVLGVMILAVAVVRILSTCRRFRDAGRTPWLTLLVFIPGVNGLLMLALLFIPSSPDRTAEDAARMF